MDFGWSDEQTRLWESVVGFARRDLQLPEDESRDPAAALRARWKRCADFGLFGMPVPIEHGGQGADAITTMHALEALGFACRDNGLIFSIQAHLWSCVTPISRFGSDEQRACWLPGLLDGRFVGVQAMTEPDTGSDAFALRTTAEPREGSFVLNGVKTFITNAPVADVFVVFARTDATLGVMGITAFLVPRSTPGISVSTSFDKMGLETSPMGEVRFDDCEVPATAMLGRRGNGMTIFNHSIDWERACILASAVGTMQRQVDEVVEFTTTREQFGQPIANFQAVSHRIADMQVRLEASRLLLYQAGWEKEHGGRVPTMAAAVAKLFISEAWLTSSLDVVQLHGGTGYMKETGLEQDVRDAVASRIYSGTSDIQRNIIAAALGL